MKQVKVLVAPLDWGLGHTSRCIYLVKQLISAGATVFVAGNPQQIAIFVEEVRNIDFIQLEGYNIKYSRSRTLTWLTLVRQLPKIARSIKTENKWLHTQVQQHDFDFVISDNRYGLHHPTVHSVLLTHQLMIKTKFGNVINRLLQKQLYKYINHFNECWVPDNEKAPTLAGEISHPVIKPSIPLSYTGVLTRLQYTGNAEIKDHLLIILSGPEPQRSILEEIIINQVAHYHGTAVIVRGVSADKKLIPSTNSLRFYNHLPVADFEKEMSRASFVISRTGYSTIMDVVAMRKKSILIPTPAQPEQEYLGTHCMKNRIAYCVAQEDFSLIESIAVAKEFEYVLPDVSTNVRMMIDELVQKARTSS